MRYFLSPMAVDKRYASMFGYIPKVRQSLGPLRLAKGASQLPQYGCARRKASPIVVRPALPIWIAKVNLARQTVSPPVRAPAPGV